MLFTRVALRGNFGPVKRRLIAAAYMAGATVPLLAATLFLVGCCVLPFHGVMHKLMPLCEAATNVMRGDQAAHDHQHDATPPAREKQEPVKRIATEPVSPLRLSRVAADSRMHATTAATAYRSFITLGAVRCDQDVGLHVLVETFLV